MLCYVCSNSVPKAMTLEELKQQTKNEVELLTSTSAKAVIPKLDAMYLQDKECQIFWRVTTAHPSMDMNLRSLLIIYRFKHRRITPYWPKANGYAERLVKTIEKKHQDCSHAKEELETRDIQISMSISCNSSFYNEYLALWNIKQQKTRHSVTWTTNHSITSMKYYIRNITSGEIVLMKQPKQNKLSTPYNPKPFAV